MSYEQCRNLSMFDAYIEGEDIYFSNNTFNAFMRVNRKNGICTYLRSFPDEMVWAKVLHKKIERYNDCLFFFPNEAKGISKYNLLTGEMNFYKGKNDFYEMANIVIFNKIACMIPKSNEQDFYLFDMEHCRYIDKKKWNEKIKSILNRNDVRFANAAIRKDKVIVWGYTTNFLIEICLLTDECSVHYLREEDQIASAVIDDHYIWLFLLQDQALVKWDKDRGILEEFPLKQYGQTIKKEGYYLFAEKGKLILLPTVDDELFIMFSQYGIKKYLFPQRRRVNDPTRQSVPLCYRCVAHEKTIYFLPHASDKMYVYNLDINSIIGIQIEIDKELYYRNVFRSQIRLQYKVESYKEYGNALLEDLLYCIEKEYYIEKKERVTNVGYGQSIYDKLGG